MAPKRASSSKANGNHHMTAAAEPKRTNENAIAEGAVQLQVVSSDKKANPIVCSFPGGLPESLQPKSDTASSQISAELISDPEPPLFEWHSGSRLTGHDEACHYTSINTTIRRNNSTRSSYTEEASAKRQTTQLAVGIFDKQTGRVKLHLAAENGAVFCLQQHVTSYVSSLASTVSTTSTSAATAAVDYRALYEDFGSAKKKRVLQSQEANRVTVQDDDDDGKDDTGSSSGWDTNMSESNRVALTERRAVLAATASLNGGVTSTTSMSSDAAVDAATMTWRRTILLPPFSLEATTPIDIYKASDICGKSVWQWARRQVSEAWPTKDVAQILWRVGNSDTNNSHHTAQWTESVRDLLDRIPYTSTKRAALSADRISAVQNQLCCAVVLHHFVSLYKQWHTQRYIPQVMMEKDMDEEEVDSSAKDGTESPRKQHPHAAAALSTPLVVRQRFLTAFGTVTSNQRPGGNSSNSTGYAMSKVNVDCCLVHILLLYLVAHSTGEGKDTHDGGASAASQRKRKGNIDAAPVNVAKPLSADHVERLVDDLRVERTKAIQLARQAGCTVTRTTTSLSKQAFGLALSTPLTFPPPRRKKATA